MMKLFLGAEDFCFKHFNGIFSVYKVIFKESFCHYSIYLLCSARFLHDLRAECY